MKVTDERANAALTVTYSDRTGDWGSHPVEQLTAYAPARVTLSNGTAPPIGWLESPHGEFRRNPLHTISTPPESLEWQIPLYTATPAPNALREAARDALTFLDEMTRRGWLDARDIARRLRKELGEEA